MKFSTLTRRIHSAARLIERPAMLAARLKGVPISSYEQWDQKWVREANFSTVLDIGANVGQFARCIRCVLPTAHIFSFEPVPDCFWSLEQNMKGAENFTAVNIGLGDQSGMLQFERNAFAPASSFLKMTELHKKAFPESRETEIVSVRIERLDDIRSRFRLEAPLLVKIDVQGYEDRVLNGGHETIKEADFMVIETSFAGLYEGQPDFDDINSIVRKLGFRYAGAMAQLTDPNSGRILQADSIFVKV